MPSASAIVMWVVVSASEMAYFIDRHGWKWIHDMTDLFGPRSRESSDDQGRTRIFGARIRQATERTHLNLMHGGRCFCRE